MYRSGAGSAEPKHVPSHACSRSIHIGEKKKKIEEPHHNLAPKDCSFRHWAVIPEAEHDNSSQWRNKQNHQCPRTRKHATGYGGAPIPEAKKKESFACVNLGFMQNWMENWEIFWA